MKILYVTTIGVTMNFFKQLIKELIDKGNIVDVATNTDIADVDDYYRKLGCKIYHISCQRTPFSMKNIKTIYEIKEIVSNNHYDIVHCHTPVASICTRIACNKCRKKGLKVFYTAHGFHFYKGAPLINWILYFPIEKYCSRLTDVLITINKEDYNFAKINMKSNKIEYVSGVGIDLEFFNKTIINKKGKRKEIGIPENAYMILSVGELSKRKNHIFVIEALKEINNKNIHYVIAGDGPLKEKIICYIKKNLLEDNIHLLGQRNDVNELYKCADLFIFPSLQEGLPVALIEALASNIPVLSSKIRGNVDILNDDSIYIDKKDLKNKIIYNNDINQPKHKIDMYSYLFINKKMIELYNNEISVKKGQNYEND